LREASRRGTTCWPRSASATAISTRASPYPPRPPPRRRDRSGFLEQKLTTESSRQKKIERISTAPTHVGRETQLPLRLGRDTAGERTTTEYTDSIRFDERGQCKHNCSRTPTEYEHQRPICQQNDMTHDARFTKRRGEEEQQSHRLLPLRPTHHHRQRKSTDTRRMNN
jgi:hypothetical protein